MATISFPYEPWTDEDVQLSEPGNSLGFAVINASLPVGKGLVVKKGEADNLIGPAVAGAVELLAGALEWLRESGLSEIEVQSKVRAYMAQNRSSHRQNVLIAASRTGIYDISDPRNVEHRLDPEKVIG